MKAQLKDHRERIDLLENWRTDIRILIAKWMGIGIAATALINWLTRK